MPAELSGPDVVELTRLVTEFVWLVDHRRADAVHELFAGEAELTLGGNTMRGVDAIAAWGSARTDAPYATRHVVTNMRFAATGPERAEGDTIVTVYLHRGEGIGTPEPMTVGEYHDTFLRVDGRWRFEIRTIEQIFRRSSE